MLYFIFMLFFIQGHCIYELCATDLLITQPGIYLLGDDINSTPVVNDNIINIQSSNVIVDLGGKTINQINSSSGVDGVLIGTGFSNITVKNGTIRGCSRNAISISQTCSIINLNSLTIQNCPLRAITFHNQSSNSIIKDCSIFNCSTSNTGTGYDYSLLLNQCGQIVIDECKLNNNGTPSRGTSLLGLINCFGCTLNSIHMEGNVGGGSFTNNLLTCIELAQSVSCVLSNLSMISNIITVGVDNSLNGVYLNKASSNYIKKCNFEGNSATATSANIYPFRITDSPKNLFANCDAFSNSNLNGNLVGFLIDTSASTENVFLKCRSINNTSARFVGFGVNSAFPATVNVQNFTSCMATGNRGETIAYGFRVNGSNWSIIDCMALRNFAQLAANSFGINVTSGSNNLCTRSIAFNNNTTPANQVSGLPAGSLTTPTAPATSNLAAITSPWTNMAIAQ